MVIWCDQCNGILDVQLFPLETLCLAVHNLNMYTKNHFSKPSSFLKKFWSCKHIYIYTSPSVFATFVRSCSALRASKRPLNISYLKSACLITPFGRWNKVNPTIFEICLLYENNNNKYSY